MIRRLHALWELIRDLVRRAGERSVLLTLDRIAQRVRPAQEQL